MAHTDYGTIVAHDETAMVDARGSLVLKESSTVAIQGVRVDEEGVETEPEARVALQLAGRIMRTEDTVSSVWMLSISDAGAVAGMLIDACHRAGGREAVEEAWQIARQQLGSRGA